MNTQLGPGVRLARETAMTVMVIVAIEAFRAHGADAIVTSGTEGQHSRGSEHYVGHALDWRTRHLPLEVAEAIRDDVAARLGRDYDVILEATPPHLHVEWDPK